MPKISKYLISFSRGNKRVFYSLLSGSFIRMDPKKAEAFLGGDFTYFSPSELQKLKASGFICGDGDNELETINRKRLEKSRQTIDDRPSFTIMTTSACNARCFYCYEKGIRFQNMTDDVINQTIRFLIGKSSGKPIHISWFGGEPLLCKDVINKICNGLLKAEVPYSSSMISNGFFAKDIALTEFDLWKLREVQITLDAVGAKYNDIKSFVTNEKDPFQIVQDGIVHLIKSGVNVSIRLNYNPETLNDTLALIDWIYRRYGPSERVMVYVANIVADNTRLPNDEVENPCIKLYQRLALYGYMSDARSFKISPRLLPCSTEYRQYFVISPNGDLFKCEHMVNNAQEVVGNVASPELFPTVLRKWEDTDLAYERCAQCVCLPICQGGCKAYRFERNDESFCTPIRSCIMEIVELYYDHTFEEGVRFKDLVLFPSSATGEKPSDYLRYCKHYLAFNKAKRAFVKKACTLKLDSQFSESLAADVFFFNINHKDGFDGEDPLTKMKYEVKGTGLGNSRVRFSKKTQADYVVWVRLEETKIVLFKLDNGVYGSVNQDGFVNLSSYLKRRPGSVLKKIVIRLD